ncbi:MAG: GNAT family N-acetyltransferase [Hyphomicrobiaceae bacterium]|nr:GNAT family N-acetyltransferase [Hyphomicrobiaceae bacterium]
MIGFSANIGVREAVGGDAERLTEICAQSWRLAYTGIIPHQKLNEVLRRRNAGWWRSSITRRDGLMVLEAMRTVAGYVQIGTARRGGRGRGEIFELYMAPDHQGVGLGELLFEAARCRLDEAGLNGLTVGVLAENRIARGFYERRGGRVARQSIDHSLGTPLPKVHYEWG